MRAGPGRGERGQVLVFFAVLFPTVLLAMAAFAIDQGLWLGVRRAVQGDVDAAVRSGAFQLLADLDDFDAACAAAAEAVERNGASVSSATSCGAEISATDGCEDTNDGARSIRVGVSRDTPGLFIRAFLDDETIDVQADATACVGTIQTLGASDMTAYLPVYIESGDSGSRSCFEGGEPVFGQECVITRACDDDPDFEAGDPNPPYRPNEPCNNNDFDTGFFVPSQSGDDCNETSIGNEGDRKDAIYDALRDGTDYRCRIYRTGACGSLTCVEDQDYPEDREEHVQVLDAYFDYFGRFGANPGCTLFEDVFVRVDGTPIAPGDAPDEDDVFIQRCESGRVGLVLFTERNGTNMRVKGFATAYITGCFPQQDGLGSLPRDVNDLGFRCQDDASLHFDHHYEVRAFLVRTYMPEADRGTLGRADMFAGPGNPADQNISLPLTIQTVE